MILRIKKAPIIVRLSPIKCADVYVYYIVLIQLIMLLAV
nr:MAG TPA: hypothetical protein [Caudoviricetes sp.]